jgi:hypothetical protein
MAESPSALNSQRLHAMRLSPECIYTESCYHILERIAWQYKPLCEIFNTLRKEMAECPGDRICAAQQPLSLPLCDASSQLFFTLDTFP